MSIQKRPSFCRTFNPKDKSKTVGFARQQLHFLCGDKANEAKENLALRLACLARYHSNINSAKIIRQSSYCSPEVDEALEDLSSSDSTKASCSYVSRY
jgi:hypothetical protein